ncbi:alpha/beta hydrolase [Candidatus Entotheonella palauensis]|uniref:alpha/beta hydrolase n=1 Tax=Candidatus Entotheonella palauensis TaxID=93172 RepID=UPI000B7CB5C6|nr:alpha/beta hydrolase [Candidatus Entotheonella palauensis]
MTRPYDPAAQLEIKVWDVEYRRDSVRSLMARVYQPQGQGPFPVLLDVHGGAWNAQDRTANAPVDERLAASGALVVAIDVRLASEAPYPASVADVNYGIRWLKSKAQAWRGSPETMGVLGSSSGGHITQLNAMRPHDERYIAHPLPEAPDLDATVTYVVARSPISDPAARYEQAKTMQRTSLVENSEAYFQPWETIFEGNPQHILDRQESIVLPPMFILQGDMDDNVLPVVQERFVAAYRSAGGEIELEMFPGCDHRWIVNPGPQTDRAIEMIKAFIARQLGTQQPVG